MCQVDATPYDWLTNQQVWNMHLAVDDATTDVLGGWFMEQECMRGYARMMVQVVTRHGVPASMYSDKDAVFRAVKDGSPTQFAHMMHDLNVRMIFANSAEAKGRVLSTDSRYAQSRGRQAPPAADRRVRRGLGLGITPRATA